MSEKADFQKIIGQIENLPEFKQKAIIWALCHLELVKNICEQEPFIFGEELEREIQWAVDIEDFAAYAILIYLKVFLEAQKTEDGDLMD